MHAHHPPAAKCGGVLCRVGFTHLLMCDAELLGAWFQQRRKHAAWVVGVYAGTSVPEVACGGGGGGSGC